jgi:hypothetical protein
MKKNQNFSSLRNIIFSKSGDFSCNAQKFSVGKFADKTCEKCMKHTYTGLLVTLLRQHTEGGSVSMTPPHVGAE